ncbi:MAG: hypothetical protein JSR46_08640, partial [Verrucomicrobia bacterium]|nr:hypothetical protein [Verrucomicrobiota bacterium]
LLDAPSKGEHEDDLRLEIVQTMLLRITGGHARRVELPPIFEKMVFSHLSLCTDEVYSKNISRAREFYRYASMLINTFTSYPHSHYRTRLALFTDDCTDIPLEREIKIFLFNNVLERQINTNRPRALAHMCNVMQSSSMSIFEKDDERRVATIVRIIMAVLATPYARVLVETTNKSIPLIPFPLACLVSSDSKKQLITYDSKDAAKRGYPTVHLLTNMLVAVCKTAEEDSPVSQSEFIHTIISLLSITAQHQLFESEAQYVDLFRLLIYSPMLQKIFICSEWDDFITRLFTLLTRPNPEERRLHLFRHFIIELLKSDDQKIVNKGRTFFNGGMKKSMYRGKLQDDHELWELLTSKPPSLSLEETLQGAIDANCPEKRQKAIALYQESFPKLTLKSPEEQKATQAFIALLCRDIDSVNSFFEKIRDLGASLLAAVGCPSLNPIDTLLWCESRVIVVEPNLEPWKERFFEIAVGCMHTLLDAPEHDQEENIVRLEIVAQLIGGMLRANPRRKLVIPIFEKMVFSRLSTCDEKTY